jgi:hypothetical protein
MRKRPELQGKLLARGGWDYELVEALAPQPGDIVLPKTRYRLLQLAARFACFARAASATSSSSASPPTSASNRRCATASSSNISG